MKKHRIELPPFAETYVNQATGTLTERVVVVFHGWLQRTERELADLTTKDIAEFVSGPRGRPIGQMARNTYRSIIRAYLRWLEERGLAGPFESSELEGYHRKPLPDDVRRFLQFLGPTHRPGTVNGYSSAIRRFHEWLAEKQILIANVDRGACLGWMQHLHDAGLHPATRVGMLVYVRKYLDWLWDQGKLTAPGRELLLGRDFPKLPDYLPRPLPPDVDEKLQQRFKEDQASVSLGLYVMRRTGLRIGELRQLERECLRTDNNGNHFLKVPLGKLHNERLVPLEQSTVAVIAELQGRARPESSWLIEGARARPISASTYRATLAKLAAELPLSDPLTTHRLRHSFATSLMNGGMSLMGIMKLLGHRKQQMTLRYTQIADETVGREYFEALSRIAERYEHLRTRAHETVEADPVDLLQDVVRWITKNLRASSLEREANLLIRRIEAAKRELKELRTKLSVPPSR